MVDLKGKSRAVKAHPDFKDQKYKVGHGKVKAVNEMKTDFKQKRIVLAKQSGITGEISDPHLDLFARCRHYAPKRRLEAFRDLHGCRSEIPAGLRANFVSVVCQGILDEEKDVRKFAGNFFHEISDSSSSEALSLSLRAALSHVQTEIRSDALKLAAAVNLGFLSEMSAVEISRSLLERRLTPEISCLLLKLVREVFTVRDSSARQWRISALEDFSPENPKIAFLSSLVLKVALPDDLKAALSALGVVFPPSPVERPKKEVAERPVGRTFAVGGRAFAGLISDHDDLSD